VRYRAALPAAATLLLVVAERRAPGTTFGSVTGASSDSSPALFSPKAWVIDIAGCVLTGATQTQSLSPSLGNWTHPLPLPGRHAGKHGMQADRQGLGF
jgi:hypothetical protein